MGQLHTAGRSIDHHSFRTYSLYGIWDEMAREHWNTIWGEMAEDIGMIRGGYLGRDRRVVIIGEVLILS